MPTVLNRHIFAPALLLLVCGSAALAQDTPDPRATAQVHLGPLYLTPRLAVEEFGVDTNVFNNADEKRDFTFTLAPHVDLWVPFARRALLTTAVTTDLVYYHTYSSERSVNPQVVVRGEGFLGRVTPFVEGSYLNSRERANFEIDVRSRREQRGVAAGARVRISPKLSLELAGRRSDLEYDADAIFNNTYLYETLNRETNTASLVVRHAITPLTTLVLRAEGGNERFEFSPDRNSDTIRITPGVEFDPIALISGSGYVGFRRFSPLSSSLQPFSGVVANGALSYTLLGSTRFTVTAERDLTYSYERLQPYFVAEGYGVTVRRQIVGRTDVTVGMQRYTYSYSNLIGVDPIDIDRVDLTRTWTASFGYRLGQSTRAGIGVRYQERESNSNRFRDYDGFRFVTSLDYEL